MVKRRATELKTCEKQEDCNTSDPVTSNLEFCELPTKTCLNCISVCYELSTDCKNFCPNYYRDKARQQLTDNPNPTNVGNTLSPIDLTSTSPSNSSGINFKLVLPIAISSLAFFFLVLLAVLILVKLVRKRSSLRRSRNRSRENDQELKQKFSRRPEVHNSIESGIYDLVDPSAKRRSKHSDSLPPELPTLVDDDAYQFPKVETSIDSIESSNGDNDTYYSGGRVSGGRVMPNMSEYKFSSEARGPSSIEFPIDDAKKISKKDYSFGVLEFTEQLFNTYKTEIVSKIQGYEDSKLQDGQAVIKVNPANAYSALHALRYGNLSYYKHQIEPSFSPERETPPSQSIPNVTAERLASVVEVNEGVERRAGVLSNETTAESYATRSIERSDSAAEVIEGVELRAGVLSETPSRESPQPYSHESNRRHAERRAVVQQQSEDGGSQEDLNEAALLLPNENSEHRTNDVLDVGVYCWDGATNENTNLSNHCGPFSSSTNTVSRDSARSSVAPKIIPSYCEATVRSAHPRQSSCSSTLSVNPASDHGYITDSMAVLHSNVHY